MGWSFRRRTRPGTLRAAQASDTEHLLDFVQTRRGVEAYLEPRTTVTQTTVVLVADTGEWTRRRIESEDAAARFARKNGIPLYDAVKLGYPRRMREWDRTKRLTAPPASPPSQ